MKATGIVRRIDDLGRVVIPKEIRRTMRIREGDPLEIYTSRDGEVIFKKYSLLGGVDPKVIAKFLPVLQTLTADQSHSMQLLNALKPYLKEEKQAKVERAARLARLITVGKRFLSEWEG